MIVATPGRLLDLVDNGNSGYWSGVRAAICNVLTDVAWEQLQYAFLKSELQPMTLRSGSSGRVCANVLFSLSYLLDWLCSIVSSIGASRSLG